MLGVLLDGPLSGYELARYFDGSAGFVWSAPESQVYARLPDVVNAGWISVQEEPRGSRGVRKIYSITDKGRAELDRWLEAPFDYLPEHDGVRLQAVFYGQLPPALVRKKLETHADYYQRRLAIWEEWAQAARKPGVSNSAVAEWRAFAFDGLVAKAKAEIRWARDGLKLGSRLASVAGLHSKGEPLTTPLAFGDRQAILGAEEMSRP